MYAPIAPPPAQLPSGAAVLVIGIDPISVIGPNVCKTLILVLYSRCIMATLCGAGLTTSSLPSTKRAQDR